MKAVKNGNVYNVYDNSMIVYDRLPARTYAVNFNPDRGFYLTGYSDIIVNEKIYGVQQEKVDKVIKSFKLFKRNLGVILSGQRGLGKSLYSKMLSLAMLKEDIPVIIVNHYVQGIADYLNSIDQEVMILLDEFDKTFNDEKGEGQVEMLTLFDGVAQSSKKLFVITCNSINSLNNYLINRPGRFHYHFRFNLPTSKDIDEYLRDNIPETAYPEIQSVIDFASQVDITYDSLRAIAFELSQGLTFKDAIGDLNIINSECFFYDIVFKLKNGTVLERHGLELDMFDDEIETIEFIDNKTEYEACSVKFNPLDAHFNRETNKLVISADKLKYSYFKNFIKKRFSNDTETLDRFDKTYDTEAESIEFTRRMNRDSDYSFFKEKYIF